MAEKQRNKAVHHVPQALRYLWLPPKFPQPTELPIIGMYFRIIIGKLNPSSEVKLCIGVGTVEGSRHTQCKIFKTQLLVKGEGTAQFPLASSYLPTKR